MICGFQSLYEFGKELCKILDLPKSSCFEEILSAVKALKTGSENNDCSDNISLVTLWYALEKYLKKYVNEFSNHISVQAITDKTDDDTEYIRISFPNHEHSTINIFATSTPYMFMIFDHTKSGLPQGLGQQSVKDVIKYVKNKLERNNI